MNKTIKKIKNIGSSPIYIISAAFLLISALFTVWKLFSEPDYIYNFVFRIFPLTEEAYPVYTYSVYIKWSPLVLLVKAVLDALLAFGMLFVFIMMCKRHKGTNKLGFGAGFIKPIVIIDAVLFCAVIILVFTLQVARIMPYVVELIDSGTSIPQNELITFCIGLAVTILMIVFMSIFARKSFSTMSAVDKTLKTGVIMGNISVYLIVYNFIVCILAVSALVFLFIFDKGEYIIKASVLCIGISHLLSNINLISLRSEMLYIKSRGITS